MISFLFSFHISIIHSYLDFQKYMYKLNLAINTVVSILELYRMKECSKIEVSMGDPGTIDEGKMLIPNKRDRKKLY